LFDGLQLTNDRFKMLPIGPVLLGGSPSVMRAFRVVTQTIRELDVHQWGKNRPLTRTSAHRLAPLIKS
jgi:hypothetical protein